MDGWIKLHRKMLDWEWFSDANTLQVFLYLLLSVSSEPEVYRGVKLEVGQCVTSREKIALATHLSDREIRTSLSHLKKTGEISIFSTNKFSVVTICNYETYQCGKSSNRPTKRPATDQQNDQQNDQPLNSSNNNILSIEEEKNKENISSSKDSDISKNLSLYGDNFNPEVIKTEDDKLKERFSTLQKWLKETCPTVCKVQHQLTFEQFKSLMSVYKAKEISKALESLDEWPDYPKKRTTVYRSTLDELKKIYGERSPKMG